MSSAPVLVLDIDGVVVAPAEWMVDIEKDFGLDPEEMKTKFFDGDFQQVLRGRLDLYVALNDYFAPKGLAGRLEEFVSYWFERETVVNRAVLDKANAWRQRTGGKVFADTNQEHHRLKYLQDDAGLGPHFDEMIYSAALGVCKPDRVFFTNAQARMGVTAAQSILFIDDKAVNVDGARMAGWRAMLYRGAESLAQALEKWG